MSTPFGHSPAVISMTLQHLFTYWHCFWLFTRWPETLKLCECSNRTGHLWFWSRGSYLLTIHMAAKWLGCNWYQ